VDAVTSENIATVLLLVLSITIHEWAHAWTTTKLGDPTAADLGRVTLNPISHSDPMWTLLIPFLGLQFGGFFVAAGRPVPYNAGRWNRTLWGRRLQRKWGEFLVAVVGPGSNLVQAFGAAIGLGLLLNSGALPKEALIGALDSLDTSGGAATLAWALQRFMYINCLLAVFNLMPIAPLDGEKVLAPFLPDALAERLSNLGSWGFLILLLVVFRLPWVISTPIRWLHDLCMMVVLLITN
jgi:Zn-dependent protease